MADLQKVVKLTSSQYATLAGGGTVGSYTGLDSSYLYLVEDSTQYVPLGGTTSLYGSIVPSTTDSYTLGTSAKRFQSVYANNLSVSTVYASWVQAGGNGVWASQVICPSSNMSIICNPGVVGLSDGGYLSIIAGSHIGMSSPNIYLNARDDMDLYVYGRNNIYGGSLVKIWAGNLSDTYPVPRMSMWLASGFLPNIEMVAEYSGYGSISMIAPVINISTTSSYFTHNHNPVVTGWMHNLTVAAGAAWGTDTTLYPTYDAQNITAHGWIITNFSTPINVFFTSSTTAAAKQSYVDIANKLLKAGWVWDTSRSGAGYRGYMPILGYVAFSTTSTAAAYQYMVTGMHWVKTTNGTFYTTIIVEGPATGSRTAVKNLQYGSNNYLFHIADNVTPLQWSNSQ